MTSFSFFFFFNDPAPPKIYPLPLPAPLPFFLRGRSGSQALSDVAPAGRSGHRVLVRARSRPRPPRVDAVRGGRGRDRDRKSTRLNSSHGYISYAVFCLKKKKRTQTAMIGQAV